MAMYPEQYDRGATVGSPWFGNAYENVDVIDRERVAHTFDYKMSAEPIFVMQNTPVGGETLMTPVMVPNKAAQVRTHIDEDGTEVMVPLSVTSPNYGTPDPQERFLAMYDAIESAEVGAECVSIDTAGNGRRMFGTWKLPEDYSFDFGGLEHTDIFLNFLGSVDGFVSTKGTTTAHRIKCTNALQTIAFGVPTLFSIKNTRNANQYVADAITGLHASMVEARLMSESIDQLLNTVFTEAQFFDMVRSPDMLDWARHAELTKAEKSTAQMERKFAEITHHYHHNADLDDGVRETAYGAMQAINSWETKTASIRGCTRDQHLFDQTLFGAQEYTAIAGELVGVGAIREANVGRAAKLLAAS